MLNWLILFFRIAGLGGNFSAGYDLGELAKIEKEDIANELVRYFSTYQVLNSQYFWKWTNANPMQFFSRAATASKFKLG